MPFLVTFRQPQVLSGVIQKSLDKLDIIITDALERMCGMMNINRLLLLLFCQVRKRRPRTRQRGPDVGVVSSPNFLKSVLIEIT